MTTKNRWSRRQEFIRCKTRLGSFEAARVGVSCFSSSLIPLCSSGFSVTQVTNTGIIYVITTEKETASSSDRRFFVQQVQWDVRTWDSVFLISFGEAQFLLHSHRLLLVFPTVSSCGAMCFLKAKIFSTEAAKIFLEPVPYFWFSRCRDPSGYFVAYDWSNSLNLGKWICDNPVLFILLSSLF